MDRRGRSSGWQRGLAVLFLTAAVAPASPAQERSGPWSSLPIRYAWGHTIGGPDAQWYNQANGVATDAQGNVYFAGGFQGSPDFDPTPGVDIRTSQGQYDIFVTMLGRDGTYGWTVTIGGPGWEVAREILLSSEGDVTIVGEFGSGALQPPYELDFDPTSGQDIHVAPGASSYFVTRIERGGAYGWTRTSEGPPHRVQPYDAAIDPAGDILFTGTFIGTVDFDPTPGVDTHVEPSDYTGDAFVTKLHADGSYGWTRSFGAHATALDYDIGEGVATDAQGNVWVTGSFEGPMDVAGWGAVPFGGARDAFIAALTPAGDYRQFYTIGEATTEWGLAVTVDLQGSAVVTGGFGPALSSGTGTTDLDPTAGVDLRTSTDGADVFVVKVDANGRYHWGFTAGGTGNDFGRHIAVQPSSGVGADAGEIILEWQRPSCRDGGCVDGSVLTQLSAQGRERWSCAWDPMVKMGGDWGGDIAIDAAGELLLTGVFAQAFWGESHGDLDPTRGSDIHEMVSTYGDVFVIKLHTTRARLVLNGLETRGGSDRPPF